MWRLSGSLLFLCLLAACGAPITAPPTVAPTTQPPLIVTATPAVTLAPEPTSTWLPEVIPTPDPTRPRCPVSGHDGRLVGTPMAITLVVSYSGSPLPFYGCPVLDPVYQNDTFWDGSRAVVLLARGESQDADADWFLLQPEGTFVRGWVLVDATDLLWDSLPN